MSPGAPWLHTVVVVALGTALGTALGCGPVAVAPVAHPVAGSAPTARPAERLTVAGVARTVTWVVPAHHDPHPALVILLHGTQGTGPQIIGECGGRAVAQAQGFILAAPDSRTQTVSDWDHPDSDGRYWQTAPTGTPETNPDLGLIRAVLSEATRTLAVDPDRIYVAGHSNGAFFALTVATVFHQEIAAFAANSGGLVRCGSTPGCHFQGQGTTCAALGSQPGFCRCQGPDLPLTPVTSGHLPAALLAHGTHDPTVSVAYTCMLQDALQQAGTPVTTVLRDGEGHACPDDFVGLIWPFFRDHPRSSPAGLAPPR